MDELISYREFARRLGISDTSVRKAIADGRISKKAITDLDKPRPKLRYKMAEKMMNEGRRHNYQKPTKADLGTEEKPIIRPPVYDEDPDDEEQEEFVRAQQRKLLKKKYSNRQRDDDEDGELDLDSDPTTLSSARLHDAIYTAIDKKIKVKEKQGELISKADSNAVLAGLATLLRQDVLGVARGHAANLKACETVFELETMLYNILADIFERHSNIELTQHRLSKVKK